MTPVPITRRRANRLPHSGRREDGFSLIEVLVSIVIMALGLLGASSLMVNAVNNATSTEISERATQLGHEMMDAMRANRTAAVAGSYVVSAYGTTAPTGNGVADSDINRWLTTLRTLPGGDGKIERVGTTNEYIITVRFANCLGTLTSTEKSACSNTTNTDARKRELEFRLNVW